MKIGINIDPVLSSSCHSHRGIGAYTFGLINGLQKIDNKNEYILFYTSKKGEPLGLKENKNFSLRPRPLFKSFFLNNIINYRLSDIDILHYPSAEGPSTRQKTIVTAHDLIPLKNPKNILSNPRFKIWNQTRYRSIKRAVKVIAVSEYTKSDLIKYLNIKPDRITVIYEGVDDIFHCQKDVSKEYILAAGSGWNKNTMAVIKAWQNLKSDLPLIINASPDKNLLTYIKEQNLENRVSFTNYISRREQLALYNKAMAFVFPSIEEGFGLPLVEAMACGLPIVTSKVSSLPEVAGTAGILVDPYNIMEISSALKEILTNTSLRDTLSQKSIERARFFSWEKTALKTLELYIEIS